MYILIFEDGSLNTIKEVNDELLVDAADDGLLDIVDIGGDVPLQYYDGEWHEIEECDIYN